jgi:hypothetical protein
MGLKLGFSAQWEAFRPFYDSCIETVQRAVAPLVRAGRIAVRTERIRVQPEMQSWVLRDWLLQAYDAKSRLDQVSVGENGAPYQQLFFRVSLVLMHGGFQSH